VTDAPPDEVIRLWPEGPPLKLAGVGPEVEFRAPVGVAADAAMLRNVSEPTLTVFRPAKPNGIGMIVCPGGGWRIPAWEHEGIDVARWLAAHGYTAFLLKYRVRGSPASQADYDAEMAKVDSRIDLTRTGKSAFRAMGEIVPPEAFRDARAAAADDGRRAVAIVRERAKEWDVDPGKVGMIGFSAGAFLVVDVAVDPRAVPLAFVAAIYGGETLGRLVPADAHAVHVHRAGRFPALSRGRGSLLRLDRRGAFRRTAHLPARGARVWHGEAGFPVRPLDRSILRLADRSGICVRISRAGACLPARRRRGHDLLAGALVHVELPRRLRLVTAGSGGPGPRPPGTTTWLREARCTDPEAMPEKEARPPAQNRHGGAPRGARPASWDAGTPLGARPAASSARLRAS
jgi:dienelactone hydrolase